MLMTLLLCLEVLRNNIKKAEEDKANMQAKLCSANEELEELKKTHAAQKSSLHRAASSATVASLGVIYNHYPDLNLDKTNSRMRCRTMEEAKALCCRSNPLADEFVKMAGIMSDSSSSDSEEDGSHNDADDSSE